MLDEIVRTNVLLSEENEKLKQQLKQLELSAHTLRTQNHRLRKSLVGRGCLELAARNFINNMRRNGGVMACDMTAIERAVLATEKDVLLCRK